jgi:hypothetical protein
MKLVLRRPNTYNTREGELVKIELFWVNREILCRSNQMS